MWGEDRRDIRGVKDGVWNGVKETHWTHDSKM